MKILVATDVASRGIDVNNLSHIINYNLPDDPEVYIHRSGRTGRAGNQGISIALISKKEYGRLKEIEKLSQILFTKSIPPTDSEVFQTQIYSFVDRMVNTPIPNRDDKEQFKILYSKLNHFTKEEIIGKIISLNIQNTESLKIEINSNTQLSKQKIKKLDDSISKLSINVGRLNGVNPESLIRLIKKTIRVRNAEIGKISIKKNYSIFEVNNKIKDLIISKMQQIRYNRQKVSVAIYNEDIIDINLKRKKKYKKKRR